MNQRQQESDPHFLPSQSVPAHPDMHAIRESFLARIENPNYRRNAISGLGRYAKGALPEEHDPLYDPSEAEHLMNLSIESRMRVKISDYYNRLVTGSDGMPPSIPLRNLVTARGEEVEDLSGEVDPSNQMAYSPTSGVLHKYEMALIYVAKTCSAHCRYCYRLDLFSGTSGKALAKPELVREYIETFNEKVRANGGSHPETGQPLLNEVLLSGGDPMVLNNRKLAEWLSLLAEAGINRIRIGTKDLAFFPDRFDGSFMHMLDRFHKHYPGVRIIFAVHFTHPDEFLLRGPSGQYMAEDSERLTWLSGVHHAVQKLTRRSNFISIENQTPIIRGVNDDPKALRILQRELYAHGIGNHYFFQCRRIEGHKAFAIPVEETLRLFRESQRGLSGAESHARFALSTEHGKMECCGLTNSDSDDGMVVFKLLRAPGDASQRGSILVCRSNPDALWIDDYRDHVIADPGGILS